MDGQRFVAIDPDRTAQPVDRQALDQISRRVFFAVEKNVLAVTPDEKIEQALALRRQQSRPHGKSAGNVVGDETLQEIARALTRQADDCAVRQGGRRHGLQLGSGPWLRKR